MAAIVAELAAKAEKRKNGGGGGGAASGGNGGGSSADATGGEVEQLRAWRTKHAGEMTFAFVGETDLAKPHYYRIATPCFTIEYDSTNADASHVHCVWSDPATNFGGDALRAHLAREHAARP